MPIRRCGCSRLAKGNAGCMIPQEELEAVYLYKKRPTLDGVIFNEIGGISAFIKKSTCATFDGVSYMEVADLTGSETVVSYGGTTTPTVSNGAVSFTAGTCWNLKLSSGHSFNFSEGYDSEIFNIGSGKNGKLVNFTNVSLWGSETQDDYHYNFTVGHSIFEKDGNLLRVPLHAIPVDGSFNHVSDNIAGIFHNNSESVVVVPDTLFCVSNGDCLVELHYDDFMCNFNGASTGFSGVAENRHGYLAFYDVDQSIENQLVIEKCIHAENEHILSDEDNLMLTDENGIGLCGN